MRIANRLLTILFCLFSAIAFSQGTAINGSGNPPDPSAGLDVNFADRGVLVPRITDAQRNAIVNPAEGLLIFNTTTKCFNVYKNSVWFEICGNCIAPNTPIAGSNGPVCSGDTLKLTATLIPGVTYSWTGPAGFTATTRNPVIPNASVANAGLYYVTASMNGCTSIPGSTSVQVTQTPSPNFSYNPSNIGINANITFTPATSGATYAWTFQGGNPSTSTSQNPVVQWASAGTYAVGLTVTSGSCSATSSQNVTVSANTVTLNTYNWNNHQYLLDCSYYGCGTTSMQATCFCNSNGYSTMVSYTTGYINTTDCFGYQTGCSLVPTWCSGGTQRYVIVTVTCQ